MTFYYQQYRFALIAICMMLGLYYSSSQPYTEQSLVSFIDILLPSQPFYDWLSQHSFHYAGQAVSVAAYGYGKFIEFFLRKGAHFTIYLCLAASFYLAHRDLRPHRPRYRLLVSLAMAILYAMSDELHQYFTPGRTALYQDVILDSFGALCGVSLCHYRFTAYRQKPTTSL